MRLPSAAALALLLTALPPAASADTVNFTAQLASEGDSQTTAAAARGTAALSLDTATRTIRWRIEYSGLLQPPHGIGCGDLTAATGPALWQTDRLASPVTGSKALTPEEVAALVAGRWVCVVDSEESDIGGAVKRAP